MKYAQTRVQSIARTDALVPSARIIFKPLSLSLSLALSFEFRGLQKGTSFKNTEIETVNFKVVLMREKIKGN